MGQLRRKRLVGAAAVFLVLAAMGSAWPAVASQPRSAGASSTPGTRLWVARYSGPAQQIDEAHSIAVGPADHNVYVAGDSTSASGSTDFVTAAYSSTGHKLWKARYDGPGGGSDHVVGIQVDPGNHQVYVAGTVATADGTDLVLVAYDTSGKLLWAETFDGTRGGDDTASSLALDSGNHAVYVVGTSTQSGRNHWDFETVAYDASGAQAWVATYDDPWHKDDVAVGAAVDAVKHNVYVTGWSRGQFSDYPDYATVGYDARGTTLWSARLHGPSYRQNTPSGVVVDASNHQVYVTGNSPGRAGHYVFGTVAYDGSGQQLWVRRFHSGREPNAIALDPENHRIYVTGKGFHGGSHGVTTLAYGPNGRRFWEARFRRGVAGVDVAADPISHNVYVAALGLTRHGVLAFTTIGYDPAGTEMWRSYYAGPERFYSPPAAIAVDGPAQHVYVTGGTSTSLGQLDFATVAYQTVSAAA